MTYLLLHSRGATAATHKRNVAENLGFKPVSPAQYFLTEHGVDIFQEMSRISSEPVLTPLQLAKMGL